MLAWRKQTLNRTKVPVRRRSQGGYFQNSHHLFSEVLGVSLDW